MLRIAELRQLKGISQWRLAQAVGVHPATISLWERGVTFPRRVHFDRLAEVFDCDPADLFQERPKP